MLHCTLLNAHGGQGRGVVGGGLMDDGRFNSPITSPQPIRFHSPLDVIENARKSQSLPGFYKRPASPTPPPQNFREAFASSYRSTPPGPLPPPHQENKDTPIIIEHIQKKEESIPYKSSDGDKKSKKFLGGIFRRRRKESSFSSESESKSESDEPKRNFFTRRGKKRESQNKPKVKTEQGKKNDPEQCVETITTLHSTSPRVYNHQTSYLITTDTGKVIKMSPTGSLGREVGSACKFEGQSLGIPRTYQSLNLGRPGVSVSHDSLTESAYGSINSSMRSSGLGRSSSTDTLTRKEKKEALKVRVERLRERTRGSSSDEDLASGSSSLFGSGSSLNRSDSIQFHRSRSSRTERYIRRKSQELETLKVETEKDKRNREAVQARILEIQKSQKGKSKKQTSKENLDLLQLYEKPKWNSQLENQEAMYYGSEMFLSGTQAPFRHQYITKKLAEAPCSVQPMSLDSQILPRNIPPTSFYNMYSNQRSVSYENHINKAASLPPQTVYIPLLPSYSLTPPVPPPRDRSSMLSPYDRNRPLSYSFENLNQDPLQRRTPQPSAASPVPPKMRDTPLQLPPASPCRRSFSERHLNDAGMNYSSLPGRPVPPSSPGLPGIPARTTIQKTPTPQGPINAQLTLSNVSSSCNHSPASHQGCAEVSQFEGKIAQNKLLAVPNMPPSPSSDYSSYVSDNSVRVQQGPSFFEDGIVEGQFEILNSGLRFPRMDLSDVFKARSELGRTRSLPLPENNTSAGTQFLTGSPAVTRSSVVTQSKDDRGDNSDSSSRSSTMEQQLKSPQNRPLSIVTEKSESGETPPLIPGKILQKTTLEQSSSKTSGQKLHSSGQSSKISGQKLHSSGQSSVLNLGQKPQPPKRNSSSIASYSRERFKQQLESVKVKESEPKNLDVDQKFREFFLKEKERLERSKCANFEEALQELEAIYKSLNLNSEDILEGAERREASGSCLNQDDFGPPRPPLHTRPTTPDKTLDDLHYRRVQANNRNQPDTKSILQMTGSYMLVSPVLGPPPSDAGLSPTSDATSEKEPDIIGDDVIVRNVQRANSVKVVDPQPPFGIPLGPVTQGPRTDYLSAPQPPQLSRHNSLPNAEPDIVSDDVAFRALRKDGGREIDNLMSDLRPSNISRSRSVPRTVCATPQKKSETQTPRKLKHHQRAKREGKFVDFFKEALTDGEGGPLTPLSWRQGPSWVERANLSDNKWDSFNTSREIQAELASLRALSQPDIRQTVISESRHPSGQLGDSDHIDKIPFDSVYPAEPNTLSSATQLVKVRSASCIPAYSKSQHRPFDPNLNISPKPFYLNAPSNSGNKTTLVNVDKLDHLIATLSLKPNQGNSPSIAVSSTSQDASNSKAPSNEAELFLPSIKDAKAKIQNAVLDSISNSNEGNTYRRRFSDVDSTRPHFYSVPSPLILSHPATIMSTSITSKHFPAAKCPEIVTVIDADPAVSMCRASAKTDKVPTMMVFSEDIEDRRSKRAASVPSSSFAVPQPLSNSDVSSGYCAYQISPHSASKDFVSHSVGESTISHPVAEVRLSVSPSSSASSTSSCEDLTKQNRSSVSSNSQDEVKREIPSPSSSSSTDIIESEKRATPSKAKRGSPRPVGASSASAQDKEKESEKRKRRLEYERQRLRQERKRTPEGEEKERKKKKEEKGRDSQANVFHRDRIKERRSPGKRGGTPPADGGKDLLRGIKSSGDIPLQKGRQNPALRDSEGDSEYHDAEDKNEYGEPFVDPSTGIHREEGSDNLTMVQERQGGGTHQDKPPSLLKSNRTTPDKPSPLKSIRTTPITADEKAEQEKRDRILRYKEERRRQMASRYGTKETSSSEEENGLPSSGSTYKRRRRPRSGLGSSTDLQNIDGRRSQVSESSSNSRKKTKEAAEIQGSSSLTAASTNVSPRTTTLNNNENHSAQDESQPAFGRDPSSEPSTQHTPPQEGRVDSADSTVSGSEGRLGGRRRASGDEKDKSHKRKSHLNRASTSEEAVYPPTPLTHLSDSNEEIPRRRRRRTPQGASESPYTSSPSNSTPDATLRLTPPSLMPSALASSDLPGYSHSAIKSQQGNLPPITPYTPLRDTSYNPSTVNSTPSTDIYFRNDLRDSDKEKVESPKTSNLKGTPIKFTPSKFSHLRKPEIPDVLRSKEQTSSITSPGVVITPSNSRPSSVVVEKPPVGPEGGTGIGTGVRISGLRSSLRKGNDSGTCFMASRRERRDEEDLNHRNGDESPDEESGEEVGQHLDNLTFQALHLKSRADNLSGENMVLECEQYLQVNKTFPPASRSPSSPPRDTRSEENEGIPPPQTASVTSLRSKTPISIDSGQKNWHGGSEGSSEQIVRRLAFEEKVRERPSSSAVPSGPPYSLDNGVTSRKNSVTSRRDEEVSERASQGILKKASWDLSEGGDPRPILKKKISIEEDPSSSDPRKSILKKKSLTDDELDWERPRSILKGARSREDLIDRSESVPSPPTPILKRGSKDHSEGECGELRPILKRRETTDGVRTLIGSTLVRRDSAPLPTLQPSHGILKKRPSSPSLELKRPTSPSLDLLTSGERSLSVAERVAGMEAVQIPGGIEPVGGGAKPKIRSRPSSRERPSSPVFFEREVRRSSWVPPSSHMMDLLDEGRRSPARALSPMFGQNTSRVSQKAAFFAQLEQDKSGSSSGSPLSSFQIKKERGTRFATQPITEGEVSKAAQMFDSPPSGRRSPRESQRSSEAGAEVGGVPAGSVGSRIAMWSKRLEELESRTPTGRDSNAKRKRARFQTQPITLAEVAIASALNSQHHTPASKPVFYVSPETLVLRRPSGDATPNLPRRMSAQELRFEDAHGQEVVKGILKSDPMREKSKDSPRSILKMDSRKSSSEGEYPKGILKSESPLSSNKGSPEHEVRSLRSVLKKESSTEDSREIKSILKPESQSLEPEISSDSSSELTAQELNSSYSASDTIVQTVNHSLIASYTSGNQSISSPAGDLEYFPRRSSAVNQQVLEEAVKQALPMKMRDNLAEALRQIEPIRDKSREREKEKEDERTITKEDVISNIREKTAKKVEEREGIFLSSLPRRPEGVNGRTKEEEEDLELNEIEACFEESVKSLSDLSQEVKVPKERVTYRHKTRQQKILEHKDRWTLNDFSPCSKMDSSPVRSPPSSDTSSGTASSSPVALLRSPALESKSSETFSATSFTTSSATLEREVITTSTDPLRAPPSAGSIINARLQSLQKNGEEGWKSRVQKDDEVILSPQLPRAKPRPTSLLERVSQLETSSQQWRDRVSQSDATKFTVAHKMASASSVPSLMDSEEKRVSSIMTASVTSSSSTFITSTSDVLSPASERKKRTPQPKVFKSKTGSCIPELLTKEGVRKEVRDASRDFARSISIPSEASKEQDENESSTKVVMIPRPDDDQFDSFFASASVAKEVNENMKIDTTDFDIITSNTSTLAVQRREVRVTRKNQTRRNPLRSLALREDLKDEYTQIEIGAGQRELRRMKVEELSKSSSLAMEALAGLASKENFSAVALRRVDDSPVSRELAPYSELMLLLVKGRRHPQVRLVKPQWDSVNQGDDFLLITPIELFHYKGRYSNVIERAVASEMALYILQTKDMGVTSALKVTDIEEGSPSGKKERFWRKLGGTSESQGVDPGPPEGDDHIEAALIASNKVFEVKDQALVPVNGAWGQSPKYELLLSDKVLVFDFGSEVYLWAGKRASMEEKKKGTVLVKELWKENYDYSDCDVNPVFPPVNPEETKIMVGPRPEWGICGKITENVETILFKEKFVDWPDTAQQSWIKEVFQEADQKVEPVCDLEPCDVTEMQNTQPEEPDLVLEMSHLGRGVLYYDEEERRMHHISTNDIHVWHISENEKKELAGRTQSQFFSGEAYVVRWYYNVTATGRTLKGTPSRHNVTGRSRVAYFFWQGKKSSLSDKGVSALMTVELDEERGPHIRVTMGHEPPAFLGIFKGGLVIHEGKRDAITKATAKLFVVRGEIPSEAHLIEYDVNPAHLRSRGCVVVVNLVSGVIHLWVGAKAASHSKEVGLTAAKLLCGSPPEEMGWQTRLSSAILREEEEGRESVEFLQLFNNERRLNRHYFFVAKDVCSSYDWTTRVWKLEAGSGLFQASELSSSYRAMDRVCPFPVWQEELYSTQQPALFLIDAGAKIYLWQGWVPEQTSDEDESASVTGSAFLRFTFARRAALQTAVFYARKKEELVKNGKLRNGTLSLSDCSVLLSPRLVISGMESLEFTNLFPVWKPREDVSQIQEKEGRWKQGVEYCAIDVLSQLSKERYTLEELQLRPLPDGVDPSRLEKYLSDQEFKDTLGVSKREFMAMPSWKQLQLKKKGNLF